MVAMFATYGAFFAVKALTKPIYGIARIVFYFDQRIRKEGFDIEWMMQQAGMMSPPHPDPMPEVTSSFLSQESLAAAESVVGTSAGEQEPEQFAVHQTTFENTSGERNA
jgi:hypothetical protein